MSRLVLAAIRRACLDEGRPLPREVEAALRADPRPGARALLETVERRRRRNRAEGQRLRHLCRYERALWARDLTLVAGIDEAGMGPLAGPVAAAAVILPVEWRHAGIDDSKRLDAATRETLARRIEEAAIAWAVGWAEPEEIDRLNIYHAGRLAMRRAVLGLEVRPQHLLVDARRIDLEIPQTAIVHGDAKSLSIAAASILAKTTRDRLMRELDRRYPGYGFARHKGYPVPRHREALARLGPCPIHRRSFLAVREADGREWVPAVPPSVLEEQEP